jgi:Uma2 family endonuclease
MATATHITLEEYLKTTYEPDADYIDGEIEERNVGEYDHNIVQMALVLWFHRNAKEWKIRVVQEQRTRLTPTRVRIPDVSVFSRDLPIEQVFTHPQLIAIEVLSPEDRHSKMQQRIDDYRAFGVPNIWVVDPKQRVGWDCSDGNWIRCERFQERFDVAGSPIYLSLDELFRELDLSEA